MPEVIFTVNRYECFMQSKNIKRVFCGKAFPVTICGKTRFVSEKKKNTIKSEMLWCNVLQITGSDFYATSDFKGTFARFRFMVFTQERINTYIDQNICKIFNCKVSFKCRCYLSFLFTVASKQKVKMKTQNTNAPSYNSKASSTQTQGVPFFCRLGHGAQNNTFMLG